MDFPTFTDPQGNVRSYFPSDRLYVLDRIDLAHSAAVRARLHVTERNTRFEREYETARMWSVSAVQP